MMLAPLLIVIPAKAGTHFRHGYRPSPGMTTGERPGFRIFPKGAQRDSG
jgi:hypothetical protein